ncbi:PorV/PorQ family protein [candidate division KSB1 bacterium]|nr:PorV/PorQ family protein [candidate division KSB1 bacterium]
MNKFFHTIIIIIAILVAIAPSTRAGNGMAFLKIGAGSRAVGMGEAFTAVSNDASATFWNPAGLAALTDGQVMFTNNRWIQDITNNFATVGFHIGNTAVGLSYIGTNIGGIEARNYASENPLTEIDAQNVMVGLSLARQISPILQVGATIKYLYEKIYLNTASGVALDLGTIYQTPIAGLSVGATIQNLGAMSKFKNESTKLPLTMRTGVAYSRSSTSWMGWTISADAVQIFDEAFHLHTGVEWFMKQFALRVGYLSGYDARNIQGGFGLQFSRYQLDYAYAPFNSDLGDSHRIGIGIQF